MSTELTKDQLAFLEECNLEFSERFTDADLEYKKIYDLGIPSPPIVHPWWTHGRGRRMNRERPGNSRYSDSYRDRNRDYNQEDRRISESPLAHSYYEPERGNDGYNRNQVGSSRYNNTYKDGNRDYHQGDGNRHNEYNKQQRYKPY